MHGSASATCSAAPSPICAHAPSKPTPIEMLLQSLVGSCDPSSSPSEAPRIWLAMPSNAAGSQSDVEMRPATPAREPISCSVLRTPPMFPPVTSDLSGEYLALSTGCRMTISTGNPEKFSPTVSDFEGPKTST
jgi:hypothetical protein